MLPSSLRSMRQGHSPECGRPHAREDRGDLWSPARSEPRQHTSSDGDRPVDADDASAGHLVVCRAINVRFTASGDQALAQLR